MSSRIIIDDDGAEIALRSLVYLYLQLPYHVKIKIAQDLNLMQRSDAGLTEIERSSLYFSRSIESGKLNDLWKKIKKNK